MPSLAALDYTTWLSGFDFTTRLNELGMEISAEEAEDTAFGTFGQPRTGRSRIATLVDVETELNGWWESLGVGNSVDEAAFTGLGSVEQVATHSVNGAAGSVAYLYRARKFTYELGGEVGDVLPFTLNLMGSGGESPARGAVAAARQAVSATGALGSAVQLLGGVPSDRKAHASLHLFSPVGTTITVVLESAPLSDFVGATTRATFGPLTAIGGSWASVPGPVTDPWWRLRVSVITGTFTVAGAIGTGVKLP